jgi:hypothetical protein
MEVSPSFHLIFRPNIRLVSTVRRFIGEFYERVLVDQEVASRLALATHELLENAVSYSTDPETSIRIEVDKEKLTIKTWNRSTYERITELRCLLDDLTSAETPEKFYQQMLEKTLGRPDGSGLGLARVRLEADMNLAYEIDQDRVCILATTTIGSGVNA